MQCLQHPFYLMVNAIRSIKPFMSLDVLRSTYFSYAHSVLSYGIIFWGNSSFSDDIFIIQKRIIRIIMNSSRNASCWQLFSPNIYIFNTFICY